MAALIRIIARHPVLAFMAIGLGAGFLTAAIRPIAEADVLPYGLPLHGFLGTAFGVGLGAFVVTGALSGRDAIVDLARRSVRWRVPVRWYLIARHRSSGSTLLSLAIFGSRALASTSGGWPRALAEVAACTADHSTAADRRRHHAWLHQGPNDQPNGPSGLRTGRDHERCQPAPERRPNRGNGSALRAR